MKYKVYTEGNMFILENTVGYKHTAPLEDVEIIPSNNKNGSPRFRIKGLPFWNEKRVITLAEMETQGGTEMTPETFTNVRENDVVIPTNYVVRESVYQSMTLEQKKGKTFDVIAD